MLDNLPHRPASLYEALAPRRSQAHPGPAGVIHTSKHASWLNLAGIEPSLLSRQCLKPCGPDADTWRREVGARQTIRNADQARLHWTFRLEDACVSLPASLYLTKSVRRSSRRRMLQPDGR